MRLEECGCPQIVWQRLQMEESIRLAAAQTRSESSVTKIVVRCAHNHQKSYFAKYRQNTSREQKASTNIQSNPRQADSSCCTTREWEAKINWGCAFAIVSSQKTVLVAHGHGCIFHRAACHKDNNLEKYFSFSYGKIQALLAPVVHPKMILAGRFSSPVGSGESRARPR